jgi:hypothetical protein
MLAGVGGKLRSQARDSSVSSGFGARVHMLAHVPPAVTHAHGRSAASPRESPDTAPHPHYSSSAASPHTRQQSGGAGGRPNDAPILLPT